ncbi:alpha/beta hydrolase [Herbaspirillum sp. ST 5-3]|uniref:alpha/beta hydrolase n=1 Tax=Oxalobacteraceae TaxID=75682 RepID=UPI0010A4D254|nr:alpha/beta hydrolase [Herbaspirillum sp. ST 5-3]
MISMRRQFIALAMALGAAILPLRGIGETPPSTIGIVIMHGKSGSPSKHMGSLERSLEGKGYLVANLEMPWSGRRQYDVDVGAGEREVESALEALRSKGARKLFVAGHSQGGVFALYFGSKHALDGVIAIAPGGDVGSTVFRRELGESVELARKMISEGKGSETARFFDTEGSKGTFPVVCTASAYLSWFDPEGAMAMKTSVRNMRPQTPVLFISPKDDYPGLLKFRKPTFDTLPPHPLNEFVELNSNHMGAPSLSGEVIARWISEVDSRAK